jgi:hypothetical protein
MAVGVAVTARPRKTVPKAGSAPHAAGTHATTALARIHDVRRHLLAGGAPVTMQVRESAIPN